MKILLINANPKGRMGNSLKLANSFVAGYSEGADKGEDAVEVETLHIHSMDIAPCKGCFACWKTTPGMCCVHDDMARIIEVLNDADLVIWCFPLYFYGVPGTLKNMIDRLLPIFLPFMSERADGYGSGSHDFRFEHKSRRHVLVSTCGFWSAEGNYDGVTTTFDHMLGKGNFETIFCGQGELFGVSELSKKTDDYLAMVQRAGREYATGEISESTRSRLTIPLLPKDAYEAMADASWGKDATTGGKDTTDIMLAEQMAACYRKRAYDGEERVVELRFTDLGTSYQIRLGEEGGEVYTDGSLETTTWIETPLDVWREVSAGEREAFKALDEQRYTVDGDFKLMARWNKFFDEPLGRTIDLSEQLGDLLEPSMTTMLIPWITFWVVVPANAIWGAVVAIAVAVLMLFIMRKHKIVVWDWISVATISVLSIVAAFVGDGDMIATFGYLVFGLMWIVSCFMKEPVCASYVKYNYGGDFALNYTIFTKTNIILAAAWGVLYVLTAIWTWLARLGGCSDIIVIVNCIIPAVMGFFTEWFEGWYPAYLARGGTMSSRG